MLILSVGSLFEPVYEIVEKDVKDEKKMIDELRIRNGNLQIVCQRLGKWIIETTKGALNNQCPPYSYPTVFWSFYQCNPHSNCQSTDPQPMFHCHLSNTKNLMT